MGILDGVVVTPSGRLEVQSIYVDPWQRPQLQPALYCRNGMIVTASWQNQVANLCNANARYRTQTFFVSPGDLLSVAGEAGAGARTRYRFAGHTSHMTHVVLARIGFTYAADTAGFNPYIRLTLTDSSGTEIGHGDYYTGYQVVPNVISPETLGEGTIAIDVSGYTDRDFRATFTDNDNSRLVEALVYGIGAEPLYVNGYHPTDRGIGSVISDDDMRRPVEMMNRLWKHGAGTLIRFSSDTDATAPTTASASDINLYDGSALSLVPTTLQTIPHEFADLRYRRRQNAATVPCRFEAFAAQSAGTGSVTLVDAAGATLATLSVTSATPAWYTTTVNLPAADQRLWLFHSGKGAGTVTTYSVCLYQFQS